MLTELENVPYHVLFVLFALTQRKQSYLKARCSSAYKVTGLLLNSSAV